MTIEEWLDKQIEQGNIHPDYKKIYHWITTNYEVEHGRSEKELDCQCNQEAGSIKRKSGRKKGSKNTIGKTERRRKETGEIGATSKIGEDLEGI